MKIGSNDFDHKGDIPRKFTCDGEDLLPDIYVSDLPEQTVSLALVIEDPDAPSGLWTHFLCWNIPILQNEGDYKTISSRGITSDGSMEYHGPCPPKGVHSYHFRVLALDSYLDLEEGADREEFDQEIKDHIIESAELIGYYTREL